MKIKRQINNKILYILTFSLLCPLLIKKDLYVLLFENVILNSKYIMQDKYKKGKIDIQLFENFGTDSTISMLGSVYKSNNEEWINIKKKKIANKENIISNYRDLVVKHNITNDSLYGVVQVSGNELLMLIYDAPSIIEINNLKTTSPPTLKILTQFDYYKNLLGLPLFSAFVTFVLVINHFLSKKIVEKPKKKPIIILP